MESPFGLHWAQARSPIWSSRYNHFDHPLRAFPFLLDARLQVCFFFWFLRFQRLIHYARLNQIPL
jgi:hypothetical protein